MAAQILLPGTEGLARRGDLSPIAILDRAVSEAAGIDIIERLVALQERVMDREAEREYNLAMNAAQSELEPIAANAKNSQTDSRYATYKAIDKVVRPIYIKHGFALSFNTGDSPKGAEYIRIFCKVMHKDGHSELHQIDMPCDGKGAKGGDVMTKTHATGAAESYGMRYILKAVFNLAVDDGRDDDGNGGTLSNLDDWISALQGSNSHEQLKDTYTKAFQAANGAGDESAKSQIIAAKNQRYKELGKR